jgi:hypothetical protein
MVEERAQRLGPRLLDREIGGWQRHTMVRRRSIKKPHRTTSKPARQTAKSRTPTNVTDDGKTVALLASSTLFVRRRRQRTLLTQYKALLSRKSSGDVLEDLDAVRGDR